MKLTSVYEYKGQLFIRTSSQTVDGLWMLEGPCATLHADSKPTEIGDAVMAALQRSRQGLPHPTSWNQAEEDAADPMLKAANVKKWNTFARAATLVAVELDTELVLIPTQNGGVRAGYTDRSDQALHLPSSASAAEVGEAFLRALALCE